MSVKYQFHEPHDLKFQIHFALSRNSFIKSRDVQYEIVDDNVVLTGSVSSFYQKQMAQESLRNIRGVGQIRNELAVVSR